MKSVVISLMLLLGITQNIHSQESKGFLIGLRAGPSFPTGTFGRKSVPDKNAGWAQTGISTHLSGTYLFNKTFGVSVTAGFITNKEDEEAVRQTVLKTTPEFTSINATTGYWKLLTLAAGPALRLPLSRSGKLIFTAKVTAGICKRYVPGYSYTATAGTPPNGIYRAETATTTQQNLPLSFCYAIEPGLAFGLAKGLYLTGAVSYAGTASQSYYAPFPATVFIVGNTTPGQPPVVYATKYRSAMNVIAAEVGIEVRL